MSKIYVVENYRHIADKSGKRPYVYRIFKDFDKALIYVENDLEYLFREFYGLTRKDMTEIRESSGNDYIDAQFPPGEYLVRPVKVFKEQDKIEYWITDKPGGKLNYLRSVIRLDSEYWDDKTNKMKVNEAVTPEYARRLYEEELRKKE
jgi:hypothetical protein